MTPGNSDSAWVRISDAVMCFITNNSLEPDPWESLKLLAVEVGIIADFSEVNWPTGNLVHQCLYLRP